MFMPMIIACFATSYFCFLAMDDLGPYTSPQKCMHRIQEMEVQTHKSYKDIRIIDTKCIVVGHAT